MKKQTSPPNRRGRLVLLCFVLGLILICLLYTSPSPRDS